MKFSCSLLESKDIGNRLFNNSVAKSKVLLKDIFGLNFEEKDSNIIRLEENVENWIFSVTFNVNEREVIANFSYEVEDLSNDLLTEVLCINECTNENVFLPVIGDEKEDVTELYKINIKNIQDYLENHFELSYTPLDPEDKDKNIISVVYDKDNFTWESLFIQEHQEGSYEVIYKFLDGQKQYMSLIHKRQHKIFLD